MRNELSETMHPNINFMDFLLNKLNETILMAMKTYFVYLNYDLELLINSKLAKHVILNPSSGCDEVCGNCGSPWSKKFAPNSCVWATPFPLMPE